VAVSSGPLLGGGPSRPSHTRHPYAIPAAVLGVTLVAWAVTVQQMQGMDNGPGTDLGGFG
jgi:hypothetical protein